jgi:hypothetical protein
MFKIVVITESNQKFIIFRCGSPYNNINDELQKQLLIDYIYNNFKELSNETIKSISYYKNYNEILFSYEL